MRRADAPQPDGGGRLFAPHLPLVQGGAAAAPTASTLRRETGRRRGETAPAPYRHLLLASTLPEDRNALGALGELAATSGAVALCADSRSCARGFQRRVVIPPLPLPPLATLAVQLQTARQMCGAAAARRRRAAVQLRSTALPGARGSWGLAGGSLASRRGSLCYVSTHRALVLAGRRRSSSEGCTRRATRRRSCARGSGPSASSPAPRSSSRAADLPPSSRTPAGGSSRRGEWRAAARTVRAAPRGPSTRRLVGGAAAARSRSTRTRTPEPRSVPTFASWCAATGKTRAAC